MTQFTLVLILEVHHSHIHRIRHPLVTYESLTPGQQLKWLESQSEPQTREEAKAQRKARRLVELSRDEESE